jgi:type II secretion system protein H
MFYIQPAYRSRGFTLLEMGLVLFILLIIAGVAVPATSGIVAQERLKSAARVLQDYAASARRLAVTEGRPYEIFLKPGGFSLQPVPKDEAAKEEATDSEKLASHVVYAVRHWTKNEFGKPAGEAWVFSPDGICEPIRVRFENADGWLEYSFNPLTAAPTDEEEHFK